MFRNLTVVAVTGTSAYTRGSMFAVARSCRELPGAQGLLISPDCPADLPCSVRHIPCKPFGYLEYNLFVVYMLRHFVKTDFCLIVQNDGWVLNGKNWRDEFWDYDFIGAPIPLLGQITGEGSWKLNGFPEWHANQHLLEQAHFYEPQNGGFSLRSKKMLELPFELGLQWTVYPPSLADEQAVAMSWLIPVHHEDVFLTSTCRTPLLQAGIRYAPPQTATRFSMESPFINELRGISLDDVFGAHWRQYLSLTGIDRVLLKEDNPQQRSVMENWLKAAGYTLETS